MITPPRTPNPEPRTPLFSWALRFVGLTIVFVFTAAPLPGDTPGCGEPEAGDESPALGDDASLRSQLCAPHCYADCGVLIRCGRYTEANRADCYVECTNARGCLTMTFDELCPIGTWGTDRVVTENEAKACADDAAAQGCWCEPSQSCFDPSVSSVPLSCTAGVLCDPR
jgi:hypothetical protein